MDFRRGECYKIRQGYLAHDIVPDEFNAFRCRLKPFEHIAPQGIRCTLESLLISKRYPHNRQICPVYFDGPEHVLVCFSFETELR